MPAFKRFQHQQGAALLITLLLSLVLGLFAITSSTTSRLNEALNRKALRQSLVFDASFNELNAQALALNQWLVDKPMPAYLHSLQFSDSGMALTTSKRVSSVAQFGLLGEEAASGMKQSMSLRKVAKTNDSVCILFELVVDSTWGDSSMGSQQTRLLALAPLPNQLEPDQALSHQVLCEQNNDQTRFTLTVLTWRGN